MEYFWHWTVLLFCVRSAFVLTVDSDNLNKEDWVNPFDMVNYDTASKSMSKSSLEVPRNGQDRNSDIDLLMLEVKSLKNEVNRCKAAFSNCSRHINSIESKGDNSLVSSALPPHSVAPSIEKNAKASSKEQECERHRYFMRRFVNLLLTASNLIEEMPPSLGTNVEVKVSLEQLAILQKFGKGDLKISLQELDDVFSKIFIGSTAGVGRSDYMAWFKPESFAVSKEVLLTSFLVFLPLLCLWKLLRGHKITSVLIAILFLIFVTSFSIAYYRMLKEEEIKQYAAMKRNSECQQVSELSWFKMLKLQIFKTEDECEQIYRKAMLEPFLKITPAIVLSEMLSESVLHPAERLGTAVASFSGPILANLPFGANYIVLLLSLFIVVMALFTFIGGKIKFPFFLGGIEMASGGNPVIASNQALAPSQTPSNQDRVDHKAVKHMIRKEVVRALSVGNAPLYQERIEEIQCSSEVEDPLADSENQGEVHKPCCCGDCFHLQPLNQRDHLEGRVLCQHIVHRREAYKKSYKCADGDRSTKKQCNCNVENKNASAICSRKKVKKSDGQTYRRSGEEEHSSDSSNDSVKAYS